VPGYWYRSDRYEWSPNSTARRSVTPVAAQIMQEILVRRRPAWARHS